MEKEAPFSVLEVSELLGIEPYLVRYFCNKGLVPGVQHRTARKRIFNEAQVNWIRNLMGLRVAGMSITEMKRYVNLCHNGNSTIPERKAMLETKKRQLWQNLENIHSGIDFIERRTEIFDQIISGEVSDPEEWI